MRAVERLESGVLDMKVLHVCRGLANSSGTTHIIKNLCEEQARLGMRVTVFHVDKRQGAPVIPDPGLVENVCFKMPVPTGNWGYSSSLARIMRARMSEFEMVHIHAIWNYPTYCAMREAARSGVPYIVAPQGSLEPWALGLNGWRKRIYRRIFEGNFYNRAACFQALSQKEAEQIRLYGVHVPAVIIPNGVQPDLFDKRHPRSCLRENMGISESERVLLFMGRLHPKKGLDILAMAFAELSRHIANVTLIVAGHDAGSGYLLDIQSMFARAGMLSKTRFIGEVRGKDKIQVLLAADAFVLPSYSEGLPVAVLEAMSAGLPVVITHGCNIPEVAAANAGKIVSTDSAEVANALRQLFASSVDLSKMGKNARALVEEKFTWSRIALQTRKLYERIISERMPFAEKLTV